MREKDAILLVEDNDDDALLFRRAVARSGCEAEVCHCTPAAAAMQHLEALHWGRGRLPTLVFVDLLLPNVRGTHHITWIKEAEEVPRHPGNCHDRISLIENRC